MFRLSHYHLFHQNLNPKIIAISDIHFSDKLKDSKLDSIRDFIAKKNPTHIFISGDLIDYGDMIDSESERARLTCWIKSLGKIAPTLIGLGNHDFYRASKDANSKWDISFNKDFFNSLNQLENIHILDNTSYEDNYIFVTGLTLPPVYYEKSSPASKNRSILKPRTENKSELIKSFNSLPKNLKSKLNENKLKFILIHSPIYLLDDEVSDLLSSYDYYISGHVHNGLVMPGLEEIWRSTRGLISPTRELFPKNLRNTIKTPSDKLIISGAITTFQKCSGKAQLLNFIYPIYVNFLEFSNQKSYQKRPKITHKYLK